jgi:hypothetical protein
MPRNTNDYWDLQWHRMIMDGRVGTPEPYRRSSSAIAHLDEAEKGKNRMTLTGKPGTNGGHTKVVVR